jgi:aspartyl-tRNA(Asn)/glutamyl-tRNA(Gln) amidotransferase subunit C
MSITPEDVKKIARLARIEVSEQDKSFFAGQLSGIMKWIEQLQEVSTEGVPQLASVSDQKLPWREDKVTDGHMQEAVLKNAPASEYGCFVVPKVIE